MRTRIMQAAIAAMQEHGIRFTMSDLARRLAVSKSTLYAYFPSKEALVGTILEAIAADIQKQQEEKLQDSSISLPEKLRAMLATFPKTIGPLNDRIIDDIRRYMPGEWTKIEQFRNSRWLITKELLQQGIASGQLRPVNLAIVRAMLFGTVDELANYQFLVQNNLTFRDALTTVADILVNGLATGQSKEECTK